MASSASVVANLSLTAFFTLETSFSLSFLALQDHIKAYFAQILFSKNKSDA